MKNTKKKEKEKKKKKRKRKRKRRKENMKKIKEKVTKSEKDVNPTFVCTPATSGVQGESPLVVRDDRWYMVAASFVFQILHFNNAYVKIYGVIFFKRTYASYR